MSVPGAEDSPRGRLARARERSPLLDRIVRTQQHYGKVLAAQQAGAMTYFGFLSIFPVLALAVFVVGQVAKVYDEADQSLLTDAINSVLPGLIGEGSNQISLSSVESFSGWAGVIGLLGVLYAGLGWLSSLRNALGVVFVQPVAERPNFVIGKLRDLVALAVLGLILVVAVGATGVVRGWSSELLSWVGLSDDLGWLLTLISLVLGLLANALLFFALFQLPAGVDLPRRAQWEGAALGAVAFEVLKQISEPLLALTSESAAFQVFGIALIMLVWINYASRAILYAAAFVEVSPEVRARQDAERRAAEQTAEAEALEEARRTAGERAARGHAPSPLSAGVLGAAATLGVLALWRRLNNQSKGTS
ncbi:YihY/virulence factor BrkB family protein [Nocardioides insulae]|uniref:YihY/virulence factor BrkB family protein n=1 Tax=Nocardioides insulae TaxID=394734 RepID=UPI001FDF0FE8|nr:YihY/virulence factor BrkB family protein [Nocardioides insulae]